MHMQEAPDTLAEPLRLIHHHPGRVRVAAAAFAGVKEDHPVVQAAHTAAVATAGFRSFSHSAKTGSIVIEYQPGLLDVDELLLRIAVTVGLAGIAEDRQDKVHRDELVNILLDAMKGINAITHEVMNGRADLRELVPATLGVVSLLSFLMNRDGKRLPRWDSALWWCQSLFVQWHSKEIARKCSSDANQGGATLEKGGIAGVPAGTAPTPHHGSSRKP